MAARLRRHSADAGAPVLQEFPAFLLRKLAAHYLPVGVVSYPIGLVGNGIENGGGDNDAPSPYQVFQTPVNVDYAESSVVAPCDLPEFHNLRVDLGRGRILVVQVPFGGAKKGDTFSAPYRIYDKPDEGNREYMPSVDSPRNRTVGAWRASLCGCCEFGPCHPTSLGAFICQCCKLPSTDCGR